MREIKFRGLDEKGNWQYGNYHKIVGEGHIREVDWDNNTRTFVDRPVEFNTHLILVERLPTDTGWDYYDTFSAYKVQYETIGEYTGFKDKHGKEIYTGDIIKFFRDVERIEIVEFRDFCYTVGLDYNFRLNELAHYYSLEVIGNIHEKS